MSVDLKIPGLPPKDKAPEPNLRWNEQKGDRFPSPPEVEAFLNALEAVFIEHGMSLGHEDSHGSFRICDLYESNIEWLRAAADARSIT